MSNKTLSMLLAGLLIHMAVWVQCASASSTEEKLARRAERVKADILKLGEGPDARVAIKLRDGGKLAGYVSAAKDASFEVTDLKSRATRIVAYTDVAQIKGHNLGTGAKIAIGIGIGIGLTILFFYIIYLSYQD